VAALRLTNPSALVPGTKVFFKIDAARDRADLRVSPATEMNTAASWPLGG
jgi:hypothetical protein